MDIEVDLSPINVNVDNASSTTEVTVLTPACYGYNPAGGNVDLSNYATIPFTTGISGALQDQIVGSVAGVATLNGLNGAVIIKATGSNSLTINGNTIVISGSASAGSVTNADLVSTSGVLSTKIQQTGSNLISLIIGLSGQSNLDYVTKSSTGSYTGAFYPRFDNPSGYITNSAIVAASGVLSDQIYNTGSILDQKINTASGFLSGRVVSLNSLNGILDILGAGNNFVSVVGNSIVVSGSGTIPDLSNYVTLINLNNASGVLAGQIQNTGSNLYNIIISTSGVLQGGIINVANNLGATGSYLFGLINASSAGISSINSQSGALNFTGAGNVSVVVNGQNFTFSGSTGIYSSFYQLSNPSNFANSGNLQSTGSILDDKINLLSGYGVSQYALISTTNLISGNLGATGQNLQSQINALNLSTGQYTGIFYPRFENPSGYINNSYLVSTSGSLAGQIYDTGNSLDQKINSLSGNLTSNYSQVKITGSNTILFPSFTGVGTNTVYVLGNTVYISGIGSTGAGTTIDTGLFYPASNPQHYITSGDVSTVSGVLQGNINSVATNLGATGSYLFGLINASSAGVGSINSTSGNLAFTGAGNVSIIVNGQQFTVSGATGIYSSFYQTSNPYEFAQSGNVAATGNSLQNQITILNSATGSYYLNSNPNSFATSGNLQSTGIALINYVNSLSGRVISLNSLNGVLNILGTGNNFVTVVGNNIVISGSGTTPDLSNYVTLSNLNNASGVLDGKIQVTGSNLYNTIIGLSGQSNIDYASKTLVNSVSGVLQGNINVVAANLGSTGSYLLGLINASSAGVGSINSTSGNLTLTGAGNVTVIVNGQQLTVSGSTGIYSSFYQVSNPSNFANSGNLQSTGSILDNKINSVSGFIIGNYSLISTTNLISGNLGATGQNLQNQINNITNGTGGFVNAFYPLSGNPSGYVNQVYVGNVSGGLQTNINTVASNLGATGANLQGQINNINIVTGTYTGLPFYPLFGNPSGYITNFHLTGTSGSLTTTIYNTGSVLDSRISSLSGYSNSNFATISNLQITGSVLDNKINSTAISLTGAIASTGQALYNYYDGLSGGLGVTGSLLDSKINSLSGYSNSNFNAVIITGSSLVPIINFTGIGGTQVILSGAMVLISGGSSAGGGETNTASNLGNGIGVYSTKVGVDLRFNSITGGTGIQVNLSGNNIFVNSNLNTGQFYPASNPYQYTRSGDVSSITNAISGNLILTGQSLDTKINNFSGYVGSNYNAVKITGSAIFPIIDVSGAGNVSVFSSGIRVFISGDTSNLATVINLQTTGSNLYSLITNLSGQANLNYATITNLFTTGSVLNARFTGLSGNLTQTGIQLMSIIANTGSQAWSAANNNGINLSGRLTTTGVNLGASITALSGFLTGNYSSVKILDISGDRNNNLNLGTVSAYFHTGSANTTWTLPALVLNTGRTYFLKNMGNTVTLTGQFQEKIYGFQPVDSYPILSGEAYIVTNFGQTWGIM